MLNENQTVSTASTILTGPTCRKFEVVLYTMRKKRSNDARLNDQITRAMMNAQHRLFVKHDEKITVAETAVQHDGYKYKYSCCLVFNYTGNEQDDSVSMQWGRIVRDLTRVPANGEWHVESATGGIVGVPMKPTEDVQAQTEEEEEEETHTEPDFRSDPHFGHVFERGHQLNILQSALEAAVESNFETRPHVALFGPPGSGKSLALEAIQAKFGSQFNVIKLDGTSITQAGLTNLFFGGSSGGGDKNDEESGTGTSSAKSTSVEDVEKSFEEEEEEALSDEDKAIIPDVPKMGILLIEEIEKGNEQPLKVLLSAMNTNGVIQQTNARGNREKSVKYLVICTVNDKAHFDKMLRGALSSRFAEQIYFPVPTRSCLEKILHRDVNAKNGNPEWVKPALDYCRDVEQTTHPRRALAVCLSGRDKLLTGEYQRSLKAVRRSMKNDGVK